MGAIKDLFSPPKAVQPAAPVAAPPPPRNITIGGTPIDRARQRRRSSLAGAAGQSRTLLNDNIAKEPLGV